MAEVPTISVLMTAYNRERYIAAAIESVLVQTYRDFELIIVDDCSTDGTVAVAERYAAADERIRIIRNQRNLGDYPNRNHAATLARGEYLKYHDSDDVMYPHCLEVMVSNLASEPAADFALSIGRNWPGGPCPMLLTPRMCYQREFLGNGMFSGGPSCGLFRTAVFRHLGGFPTFGVASDGVYWLRACARSNVLLLPGDLFWYRIHAGQELQSERASRDYAVALGESWKALHDETCPLTPAECEQAKRNFAYNVLKVVYRDVLSGRWRLATLRLKCAGLAPRDWIRYARRQRRDVFAGTPMGEAGEFLIPDRLKSCVAVWSSEDVEPSSNRASRGGLDINDRSVRRAAPC